MVKFYPAKNEKEGKAFSLNDIVALIRCKQASQGITNKEKLPFVLFSVAKNHTNKKIVNITEHSGLFILDFDRKDNPDVNFISLKNRFVNDNYTRVCFSSPSGGLKVIVEANINPTDLHLHKLFYKEIAEYYSNKYHVNWDTSNINLNRGCYIPHDKYVYYNPNSTIFQVSQEKIDSFIELKKNKYLKNNDKTVGVQDYSLGNNIYNTLNNKIGVHHYTLLINTYKEIYNKYRFPIMSSDDPLLDFIFEMNYFKSNQLISYKTRIDEYYFRNSEDKNIPIYIEDGLEIADITLLRETVIQNGLRNKTIGSISLKLIYNNPLADYEKLLIVLHRINLRYCEEPLSNTEVESIFNSNYKKYLNGELDFNSVIRKTPKGEISKKYVFFSRYCTLLKDDKREVAIRKYHEMKRDKTSSKIYVAIEQLQQENKKITKENIKKITGLSISTIKRKWKPFMDIIDDYNESAKIDNSKEPGSVEMANNSIELVSKNRTSIPEIEEMIEWFKKKNQDYDIRKKLDDYAKKHYPEKEFVFVLEDFDDY